jgi:hypothetical protein
MNLPGQQHFKGIKHFLNRIRCHPPGALVYYHNVEHSLLFPMLCEAVPQSVNSTLVYFTDSSHADFDEQRSTGSYVGFLQGGVIDYASFVPQPIPFSSAESESNALCHGVLAAAHACHAFCDVLFNDPARPYTVPFFVDSTVAEAMNRNERISSKNKHIEKRYLIHRHHRMQGYISVHHVNGNLHNIADLGTKSTPSEDLYKLSTAEKPMTDYVSSDPPIKEG